MALGLGATDENLISVIAGTWGLNQLATTHPGDGRIGSRRSSPGRGPATLS